MAAPTVDFHKIEAQAVINSSFCKTKDQRKPILLHSVKVWVSRFQSGHFEVTNDPRSERPTSTTTEDKDDTVHAMILENRQISAKITAETQPISCERLDLIIIYNILDKRKHSAKWLPKCLNADQKRIRVATSQAILDCSAAGEAGFMTRLDIIDVIWLYHYGPQIKQQSMEWGHNGSLRLKKFRTQNSVGKILASVFWDKDGVLFIKYLPESRTINTEYYMSPLDELRDALKQQRRG
eukprot:XP_014779351.1 PREDICTED: uncharacterized protein LOC106875635 [Octopus bimaculoides]